jgi:hypothetical protein
MQRSMQIGVIPIRLLPYYRNQFSPTDLQIKLLRLRLAVEAKTRRRTNCAWLECKVSNISRMRFPGSAHPSCPFPDRLQQCTSRKPQGRRHFGCHCDNHGPCACSFVVPRQMGGMHEHLGQHRSVHHRYPSALKTKPGSRRYSSPTDNARDGNTNLLSAGFTARGRRSSICRLICRKSTTVVSDQCGMIQRFEAP